MTLPSEAFCGVMAKLAAWEWTGFLDRCDRCAAPDVNLVIIHGPMPIRLVLCDSCMAIVARETDAGPRGPHWKAYQQAMAVALAHHELRQGHGVPERSEGQP
jgi:hypothetical protein